MPQITGSKPRHTTIAAVALAVLASVVLAACGSSSTSSTSTSANASGATPKTSTTGPGATTRGRFTAVRECLQKNGITLPKPTRGKRPGGGFLGGAGGGPTLPKGVSKAQYEAAIKKCGGLPRGGFAGGGGATAFSSPAAKQALVKFAACMRENGVNVPAPNTSGKGPVFNSKGLDTSSSKFAAAESKCRTDLLNVFRKRPGSAAGAPGAGAPGAGGPGAAEGAPPTG
jgi:hypothetical protein